MPNRWERLTPKIAAWVAAGNEPPDAGRIKEILAGIGVEADVSVMRDGTIVVDSDATYQKLGPAIDAIVPDAPDPETTKREMILTALRARLALIREIPAADRTPLEATVLLMAALDGLDDAPATGR